MVAVEIMLRTGFCAVPAFRRVDPVSTSGPASISTGRSASSLMRASWLQHTDAVWAPACLADPEELEAVASAISIAPRTVLFGVGSSGLVADDLSQKLERIGLVCQHHNDTHVQLVHAALCGQACVAVGISFSGNTQEVVEALTAARAHGATTVAMTGVPQSPVAQLSDHVLVTPARETQVRAGAMSSRMSQLAVIDFLFARVAQLCMDDLETFLTSTRTAVSTHRT